MLTATILALVAAVLHAAWNLSVKQSVSDRFIALWGQFFFAGVQTPRTTCLLLYQVFASSPELRTFHTPAP